MGSCRPTRCSSRSWRWPIPSIADSIRGLVLPCRAAVPAAVSACGNRARGLHHAPQKTSFTGSGHRSNFVVMLLRAATLPIVALIATAVASPAATQAEPALVMPPAPDDDLPPGYVRTRPFGAADGLRNLIVLG